MVLQTADVDVAQLWCEEIAVVDVEELMIKTATGLHQPGSRPWFKYNAHQTTDALIGGVTGSLRRAHAPLLGRYASETGPLHYAGRTTQPSPTQAAVVAPLLTAARAGAPWPDQLTVNWRSQPTRYRKVEPLVVVEIRADIATNQGRRWRHAVRLLRVRGIAPDEVLRDLDLEA